MNIKIFKEFGSNHSAHSVTVFVFRSPRGAQAAELALEKAMQEEDASGNSALEHDYENPNVESSGNLVYLSGYNQCGKDSFAKFLKPFGILTWAEMSEDDLSLREIARLKALKDLAGSIDKPTLLEIALNNTDLAKTIKAIQQNPQAYEHY